MSEGVYGLRYIADTTSPLYWLLEIALGFALVGAVAWIPLRSLRPVALSVVTALAVAARVHYLYPLH